MSCADYSMISSRMVLVDLVRAQELVYPDWPIEYCWFLEGGIASVVTMSSEGHETETGIVGSEGMVNVATILGADTSPNRCFVQIPGKAYRLSAALLAKCLGDSAELRTLLHRYVHSFLTQISSTALANASFTVEQRLARWLLMCGDRLGRDEIHLTHEFLSVTLNVRRAGVTNALIALEAADMLTARRGIIKITNRPNLTGMVSHCYTPLESAGAQTLSRQA